jgi:hypothetical protein
MKKIVFFIFPFLFLACTSTHQSPLKSDSISIHNHLDSSYIHLYLKFLPIANEQEKKFINKMLYVFSDSDLKSLDATKLIIGKIDDDNINDTIYSHVYVFNDTVIVKSSWKRKGVLIWSDELKDPYLWISDNELFKPSKRSILVNFTIGYYHAIPSLIPKSNFNELNVATRIGVQYFKEQGLDINEMSYYQYILNFKGSLLLIGHPESRACLIWYEPLKSFVPFWIG